jgi:hypothetical protein
MRISLLHLSTSPLLGLILRPNPTLKECEDDNHIPEMGTWESSEAPESSELNCRGQNTSH